MSKYGTLHLQVSSSQDKQRKPTVADLERARKSLDAYQQKMKEQETTIQHLANQKKALESQKKQLLQMAESVRLSSSQNNVSTKREEAKGFGLNNYFHFMMR